MIKQKINGRSAGSINAKLSTADATTLMSILAGENTEFEVVSEGGVSATGITPNYIGFSVGKKGLNDTASAGVRIPHIKPTKKFNDIKAAVVGVWDEDFDSTAKCEYAALFAASSKG